MEDTCRMHEDYESDPAVAVRCSAVGLALLSSRGAFMHLVMPSKSICDHKPIADKLRRHDPAARINRGSKALNTLFVGFFSAVPCPSLKIADRAC